jgi:fibro-slime domain-containing protein
MTRLYGFLLTVVLVQGICAQMIIHIRNPWVNDPSRVSTPLYLQCGEFGGSWYPGIKMKYEGCNWFTYTFVTLNRTTNDRLEFMSVIPNANDSLANAVYYRPNNPQIVPAQIFNTQPATVNEVWMTVNNLASAPQYSFTSPAGSRVIHMLKPWDLGAPLIQIQGAEPVRMKENKSDTRCGWFSYVLYCDFSSTKIRFVNSLVGSFYSQNGLGDSSYFDISTELAQRDSVWIFPNPQPDGPPVIQSSFPGITRPCGGTVTIAGIVYDKAGSTGPLQHPDFNTGRGPCWGSPVKGLVKPVLGNNGKPVANDTACLSKRFYDWFIPETLNSKYTNVRCYNLNLRKNGEGLWEYDTSEFWPIEDFIYLDSAKTVKNPYHEGWRNYAFTMEVDAEFEYVPGQMFYFRGDDDVWVFINKKLVVDIGGIHYPQEGSVDLDTLGLKPDSTYAFKLFFAERWCCGSNFRMVTSINLRTSSNLITRISEIAQGKTQFDMLEKRMKGSLSCQFNGTIVDTVKAIVDFFIEGPPFPATPPTPLSVGSTSFGGITILDNSTVILDTNAITGLPPGDYLIRYYLRSDHSQGGTIPFTVRALPLDHVDILIDSIPIDPKKDAQVDSIVIGMIETSTEAYAVLRDSAQTYRGFATNPQWTVRDPTVVTVTPSTTLKWRCMLTKVKAGRTWLVVNHAPNLKPDSTQVITYELPLYPVIVSGVMQDTNADLVPDLLSLRLSDTFKINQRLDSVHIAYKGQIITVLGSNVSIRGTQLSVPVPASVGIDGRPTGTATICMTIEGGTETNTHEFTDGVCPAIIAADVLENDGTSPDVLFLTFSEPLTIGSVVGKQLLLIPQGTTDTVALTITQILGQANDSTFTVQTASTDRKAIAGDRLRLIPGSAGGTLTDKHANKPHDLNRSVVIGFKPGAAAIAAAWYLDMNADGILDNVVVRFKRKVEQAEVESARIFRDPKHFVVDFSRCTRLGDSTYRIPIGDTLAQLNDINTQGAMDLSIIYKALPDILRVARVADSAAPVIKTARLVPGSLTQAGTRGKDTLTVAFSEGVVQPGQSPFLLSTKSGGLQYAFSLTYVGATAGLYTYKFIIESINNPSVLNAMAGDTIWINPSAGVSDNMLNTQSNPKNRRVLLQVDWPQAKWNIEIWKNPFSSQDVIKEPFKTNDSTGTAIRAIPTTPVDLARVKSQIILYDAVGNVLLSSTFKAINGTLRFCWNGTNNRGRLVAPGAYLALIKITDNGGRVFMKTVRIGVRR